MDTALLAARVLLAVVFGTAGIAKLWDPEASRATLQGFGVGASPARVGARLLAPAELLVALAMLFVPTARWAALGAAVLLVVFCVGIANALRQGRTPDCGCFGQLRPTPVGRATLARNGALLAVALFVAVKGPGPAIGWAGAIAVVVAGAVVATRALRTRAPAQPPVGDLQIGQRAPAFDLESVRGGRRTMVSLCEGGRPVVLVFGNPTCGPCREIFANLRRWQASLAGSLRIAVISFGDADATRSLSDEFGVNDVLLDIDGEAWRAYGMPGNPAAATIAPDGTIVTAPVVGQDAIEELIRLVLRSDDSNAEPWKPTIHAA